MKHNTRAFVAVKTSGAIRGEVAKLIDRFRAVQADVKWVETENLHLTLKFLGDVAIDDIHGVCRAVEEASGDEPPFDLEICGAGAFPKLERPRTLWLGAGEGTEAMVRLNERLESALAKLGFRREARRYTPHLTIGRVRRTGPAVAELGQVVGENREVKLGRTRVAEVILFSSRLLRSGPVYEVLGRVRLSGT